MVFIVSSFLLLPVVCRKTLSLFDISPSPWCNLNFIVVIPKSSVAFSVIGIKEPESAVISLPGDTNSQKGI